MLVLVRPITANTPMTIELLFSPEVLPSHPTCHPVRNRLLDKSKFKTNQCARRAVPSLSSIPKHIHCLSSVPVRSPPEKCRLTSNRLARIVLNCTSISHFVKVTTHRESSVAEHRNISEGLLLECHSQIQRQATLGPRLGLQHSPTVHCRSTIVGHPDIAPIALIPFAPTDCVD